MEAKASPRATFPGTRDGLSNGVHTPPAASLKHGSLDQRPEAVTRLCCPDARPDRAAFAQGPFAPEALPSFIAPMGPCADPAASHPHFRLCPYREHPCRLRHPRLVNGTVPILLRLSVLKCCAPYAGGSPGAIDQFFPGNNGLRPSPRARLSSAIEPTNGFPWEVDFGTAGIPLCCGPPACSPP